MKSLSKQIDQIEQYISKLDVINQSVSQASVGWHLDHMLRVINSISKALKNSEPKDYSYKFNFWRTVIFATKHIPRGKGKSPKQVLPNEIINEEDILERMQAARINVKVIRTQAKKSNFPHPYFGQLKLKQSILFIRIHTKHHLKIVADILKST